MLQSKRLMDLFLNHPNQGELLAQLRAAQVSCTWDMLWSIIDRSREPNIELLASLAAVFEVDIAYLLTSRYSDVAKPSDLASLLTPLHLPEATTAELLSSPPTLAKKMSVLLRVVGWQRRQRLKMSEIAKSLKEQGITVSADHLLKLADGRRSNPGLTIIEGLSSHFGIDVSYFTPSSFAVPLYAFLLSIQSIQTTPLERLMTHAVRPDGSTSLMALTHLLDSPTAPADLLTDDDEPLRGSESESDQDALDDEERNPQAQLD